MKKIQDERLVMQNLKNIRIAFLFQTICIMGILIYEGIIKGLSYVTDNPLWLVLISTSVILGYLNLRISLDMYESTNARKPGPYYKIIIMSVAIGLFFWLIYFLSPEGTLKQAIIFGVVMFVCFLIPFSVGYFMLKKRYQDKEEE